MRLAEVAVTNYRSIGKTERFAVDDYTVLVGPNNEGKSNLLRALDLGFNCIRGWSQLDAEDTPTSMSHSMSAMLARRINPSGRATTPQARRQLTDLMRYDYERDFPRNHKNHADGSGVTTIRLKLHLSDGEVARFKSPIGSSNNGELPIRLEFRINSVKLAIQKQGPGGSALNAKSVEITQNIVDSFGFYYIPALRTADDVTGLVQNLVNRQLSQMQLNDEYRTLRKAMNVLRDKAVSGVSESLARSLSAYIPNLSSVRIETLDPSEVFRVQNVHFDDGVETELGQKGDGIKSLAAISMMQESSRLAASSETFVLAIEEPEAHLHPEAIHDMKKRLLTLAADRQVIVSTHNPVLVNRSTVSSNVIVEKNEARPARSIAELRGSLGVRLSDNMSTASLLVLVEGVTDERVLSAVLTHKSARIKKWLADGAMQVLSFKGTGKLQGKIDSLRAAVTPYFIVTDNDDAGRTAITRALAEHSINHDDYVALKTVGMRNSELENFYEPKITVAAVKAVTNVTVTLREVSARRQRYSDMLRGLLDEKGVVTSPELVEEMKIVASNLVSQDVTKGIKPEWAAIFDELVTRLETRMDGVL